MEKKLIPDGPSPLEEEFQHEFTELIDQYKKDFLTHGWSAGELAKWCKEMVDKEFRESEDERMRKLLIERLLTAEELTEGLRELLLTYLEKQKEQKPISTEEMPYITDEHFYEREPADSFKYKLAEYMTKCCTKKEGPYGYEYGISAESILKMAEEELLKRGVVQKPAEWGEEDEKHLNNILDAIDYWETTSGQGILLDTDINWLKSLRPSWKPSEEQLNALNFAITYFMHETNYKNPTELRDLYDNLLKLKSL